MQLKSVFAGAIVVIATVTTADAQGYGYPRGYNDDYGRARQPYGRQYRPEGPPLTPYQRWYAQDRIQRELADQARQREFERRQQQYNDQVDRSNRH